MVETSGDRRLDVPIWELGGKGVFVKEVQAAVLDGRADLAVHSAKDLPSATPEALVIAAVPERADVRDALVGATLADLPEGAVVATGSLRRRAQIAHARPDLRFEGLRGNMATRVAWAGTDGVAAVVVAAAALDRLAWGDRIAERLGGRRGAAPGRAGGAGGRVPGRRRPRAHGPRRHRGRAVAGPSTPSAGSWPSWAETARCRPRPTRRCRSAAPTPTSPCGAWWPPSTAPPSCATRCRAPPGTARPSAAPRSPPAGRSGRRRAAGSDVEAVEPA